MSKGRFRRIVPLRFIQNLNQILDKGSSTKRYGEKKNLKGNKSSQFNWQPAIKNTILVIIAITLAEKFRINDIARCLPVSVMKQKDKQKRLLRFLSRDYPTGSVMHQWCIFVLQKVYLKLRGKVVLLIDETDLFGPYKAIVVAIPFRKRAIPIFWKIYTNEEIQHLLYLSHNTLVWSFLDELKKVLVSALGKKRETIWIFDRGFADVKLMKRLMKQRISFIIRVKRNVGIKVSGYVGNLGNFQGQGYFPNVLYHQQQQIRINLYCAWDKSHDEPMLLVSNNRGSLALLYRQRMKIEEAFRDLKSLFGFRSLVLKNDSIQRIELLWLLSVMAMGLSFLLYEKSGYRWAKRFNDTIKRFSLIHVIKRVLKEKWSDFLFSPYFTLPLMEADIVVS
jgi:hypothetical protein